MSHTIRPLTVGLCLLALTACVGPLERGSEGRPQEGGSTTTDTPTAEPGTAAVVSLIEQSRLAYEQGDYNSAIASAERGLRIDRREPEFYLVLAQCYLELARPVQAQQFALQGLRHTPPDSRLYQALEMVKVQSSQNNSTLRF